MLIHFILKQKLVPFEKSKRVSFASSIVKNMVVFAIESQARFPEKIIDCIDYGSASRNFCLLKLIAIIL